MTTGKFSHVGSWTVVLDVGSLRSFVNGVVRTVVENLRSEPAEKTSVILGVWGPTSSVRASLRLARRSAVKREVGRPRTSWFEYPAI